MVTRDEAFGTGPEPGETVPGAGGSQPSARVFWALWLAFFFGCLSLVSISTGFFAVLAFLLGPLGIIAAAAAWRWSRRSTEGRAMRRLAVGLLVFNLVGFGLFLILVFTFNP